MKKTIVTLLIFTLTINICFASIAKSLTEKKKEQSQLATEIKETEEKINNIDGISSIRYKNKDEAFEQAKEMLTEWEAVLEGYEGEDKKIFPPSFIVTLSQEHLDNSLNIKSQIEQIEGVDSISLEVEIVEAASDLKKKINIITIVILAFSIISSVLIISNTIKISLHSKRKEISIMKYVGATNEFIRMPFLVQGATTGIISAGVSTALIAGVYNIIKFKAQGDALLTMLTTLAFNDIVKAIVVIFLSLVIITGMIGSYILMKKYLEV